MAESGMSGRAIAETVIAVDPPPENGREFADQLKGCGS